MNSLKENIGLYASLCLIALLLGFMFSDALLYMTRAWESEEYSHGYLIPVISFWFIWSNRDIVSPYLIKGSWLGLVIVIVGLFAGLMGELASLYIVTQYAFFAHFVWYRHINGRTKRFQVFVVSIGLLVFYDPSS